jgi:hypothetical protein
MSEIGRSLTQQTNGGVDFYVVGMESFPGLRYYRIWKKKSRATEKEESNRFSM